MSRSRLIDQGLVPEQIQFGCWPQVDLNSMSDDDRAIFLKRKEAVEYYLGRQITNREIELLTGIKERNLHRFVTRCISYDQNGLLWGYRALIPQKKIKDYKLCIIDKKQSSSRMTGEFNLLLDNYPVIQDLIHDLFLGKGRVEPVMRPKYIHKKFLEKCKELNISITSYPFTTESRGYRALCRYLEKLRDKYFGKSSSRYGHDAEQKAKHSGQGEQNYPRTITPYQKVQFDGHRIDGLFAVIITTPDGDEIIRLLDRIWLLSIIDIATRNIIGKPTLCLNKEYNESDVMQCVRNAVMPYKRISLSIDGLTYQDSGGYPSEKYPEIEWALWDIMCFDNAKSHLSNMVKDRLQEMIGCAINLGPVDLPMCRSIKERFFETLEANSFHRMLNTTGSHPTDPRRRNPEEAAIKYEITYDHLEQLIEVVVANYNGTPHGGLYYQSPLECLGQRMGRGMLPRLLDQSKRSEFLFFQTEIKRTVRGSIQSGKRPYIDFFGAEYRSDLLAHSAHLIGTELTLHVNVDDIRTLRAFLPDGSEMGYLVVAGKWSLTPHTLNMRKAINRLVSRKLLQFINGEDPIFAYYDFLAKQAKEKPKRKANKVTQVKKVIDDRNNRVLHDEQIKVLNEEKGEIDALERARWLADQAAMVDPDIEQIAKYKTIIH